MECAWCSGPIPPEARCDSVFCGRKCRQTSFRLRRRGAIAIAQSGALRFAYADPPYPTLARRYYRHEPTYAGEVDHAELVAKLVAGGYAGWALSTSEKALRDVLPLCPRGARVCPWVKPIGVSSLSLGIHTTWEALIVVGGRQVPPGRRDWLCAMPARLGGTLAGRKPIAFCAFLFAALGMQRGDDLDDLYPGTGIVLRAWHHLTRRDVVGDASAPAMDDASSAADTTATRRPELRTTATRRKALDDASPPRSTTRRSCSDDASTRRPSSSDG